MRTYFSCEPKYDHGLDDEDDSSLGMSATDKEWTEFNLPSEATAKTYTGPDRPIYNHDGWLAIDAQLLAHQTVNTEEPIKHYLDPEARGPTLSASVEDTVKYPLLDRSLRTESREDLRKYKYWSETDGPRRSGWCRVRNSHSRCYLLNGGGGANLAGRMWQSKFMAADGQKE